MPLIKSISFKLIYLIILLISFNYIYVYFFLEADLQKHSPIINIVRKAVKDKSEIIYVAESSNMTVRDEEADKRVISQMIQNNFPKLKIGSITHGALHAGIFYDLLQNIPEKSTVKTLVVTMNLRSFGPDWIYSTLETSLQKSAVLLKNYPPLVNRLFLSFKAYDIKTDKEREKQMRKQWKNEILKFPKPFRFKNVKEWDGYLFDVGIKNPDGTKNQALTELACCYVKTYAFQIDVNKNPRIKDFDNIVELAKERNWNLIFNILAENTETAKKYAGDELLYLMRKNKKILISRYTKKGVIVIDNLEKVPNEEFIDQNWATEHYGQKGRNIITQNVSEELKKIYPTFLKD